MRPQLRYVKEVVMYALRKSTIRRTSTMRLMSDQTFSKINNVRGPICRLKMSGNIIP
jgi:hypothetical protein